MKQQTFSIVESIKLNLDEVVIINYALEELMNSYIQFGPSSEQLSNLITKFDELYCNLKQNKY